MKLEKEIILSEVTQTNMIYSHLYVYISCNVNDKQPIIYRTTNVRYKVRD